MKKPTSTFWICLSILVAGLFISIAIYQANRYEYDAPMIVDKYTGHIKVREMMK
jgi:hypothetical protein